MQMHNTVVIPKRALEKMNAEPGDYILFYENDGTIFLRGGKLRDGNETL